MTHYSHGDRFDAFVIEHLFGYVSQPAGNWEELGSSRLVAVWRSDEAPRDRVLPYQYYMAAEGREESGQRAEPVPRFHRDWQCVDYVADAMIRSGYGLVLEDTLRQPDVTRAERWRAWFVRPSSDYVPGHVTAAFTSRHAAHAVCLAALAARGFTFEGPL